MEFSTYIFFIFYKKTTINQVSTDTKDWFISENILYIFLYMYMWPAVKFSINHIVINFEVIFLCISTNNFHHWNHDKMVRLENEGIYMYIYLFYKKKMFGWS